MHQCTFKTYLTEIIWIPLPNVHKVDSTNSISNYAENGQQNHAAEISSQFSTSVRCTECSFVQIHPEKLSTKFAYFQPAWWMLIFILSVCLELYDVALWLSWSLTLYFRRGPPQVGDAFTNQKKEFGVILQFKKNLTEFE